MNITFIGGGSLRILPIIRSMLRDSRILQNGEIRLYDIDSSKAAIVVEQKIIMTENLNYTMENNQL